MSIYDPQTMHPRARTGSAHTAVAAAIDASKTAPNMTDAIWQFYLDGPHTPEEVHAKMTRNGERVLLTSVRARICGLHKAGRLIASGEKGLGESMRIPDACVTSLYGDGGSGKTMLALALMVAMAARSDVRWLDERVFGWKSVGLFAEDDEPELIRRLHRISEALDVPFEQVASDVTVLPGVGLDTIVAGLAETGDMVITPIMDGLIAKICETNATLLVLDYAAALFGGNELDRYQVSSFMRRLNAVAREMQIAILLLGHPSMEGMKGGRGTSGSTAWRNQSRSFLHLTVDDTQDDPDGRTLLTLKHTKSNYGRAGRVYHLASDGSRFDILDAEDVETRKPKGPRLSPAQKVALQALRKAQGDASQPSPGGVVPLGVSCVTIELWRQHAYSMGISPSDSTEGRRRAFHRAKLDLQAKGLVGVAEPLAWLIEAGQ